MKWGLTADKLFANYWENTICWYVDHVHEHGSINVACFVIFRVISNYLNFNKVQEIYRTLSKTNFTKCPEFFGGSDSKASACNAGSLGWEDPLENGWLPIPSLVFLSGEFHGQRSLVGCSPWVHKESKTTEWLALSFSYKMYKLRKFLWCHCMLSSFLKGNIFL